MDDSDSEEKPPARPYLTRLRLALGTYTVHFANNGYITDKALRALADVCSSTLEDTRRNTELREELGLAEEYWDELSGLMRACIPWLERRSFAAPDPATPEYEGLSGPLIASYSIELLRDLERLNQVIAISRNALTVGEKAQDIAAYRMSGTAVCALINVCVRVTARGYDGEAGSQDEDKWQAVINAYKKLLITCLQFINNLTARNEQRKLMLWIELFDSHLESDLPNFADMKYKMDMYSRDDRNPRAIASEPVQAVPRPSYGPDAFKIPQQPASSPFLLYIGETGNDVKKSLAQQGEKAGANEIAAECKRRWQTMGEEEKNKWNILYADVVARYRDELTQSSTYKKVVDQHAKNEESVQALAESINQLQVEVDRMRSAISSPDANPSDQPPAPTATAEEKRPAKPAIDDSMIHSDLRRSSPAASPSSPPLEDDDNDDDLDDIPGDEGRGLLTDVPLILGPTEIEVLPMIIMGGIVEPTEGQPGYHSDPTIFSSIRSMHNVRCHLLLAQDNGRNLLRELLIFVAAWDLREEELYFKFMVKIMEAILTNQLLPFAYHAFRESESKDIISPAQAVIMKLLTNIFRARQARASPRSSLKAASPQIDQGDAHMVNFLLTEFRRHIIPQTCALIFLQGQIRAGHAQPEDFPLNLWDMERMYEGVYQYLEFFAILTEHEVWKNMLSNWEISTELVTLLKELDVAIPKGQLAVPPLTASARGPAPPPPSDAEIPQPVAVERPYDTTNGGSAPEGYMPSPRPYIDEAQEEPSEFEWRNLKKLAVLVLSSLVWKNRKVQDQIRPLGGIEAILNCCNYDEHNPYIREHAIMCLRFLMEGNKENQDRIRALERYSQEGDASSSSSTSNAGIPPNTPKIRVPDEVLDQQGYETYMDNKGQVMLRKREVKVPVSAVPGKGKAKLETRDPKDLEQLVQQVMRELPARVQGVRHDAEKAAALAKLDRGFEQ